jgi:hypothetical protein
VALDGGRVPAHLPLIPLIESDSMRPFRFAALLALALAPAGCVDTQGQARMAQAVLDMETEVSSTQQDLLTVTNVVDSLRRVVAYQDTLINRLATLTNVPWPPPRR